MLLLASSWLRGCGLNERLAPSYRSPSKTYTHPTMRRGKYHPKTVEQSSIALLDRDCQYYSTDSKELQKNGKISEESDKLDWDFGGNHILHSYKCPIYVLFFGGFVL